MSSIFTVYGGPRRFSGIVTLQKPVEPVDADTEKLMILAVLLKTKLEIVELLTVTT
jgi:hypothetical protein